MLALKNSQGRRLIMTKFSILSALILLATSQCYAFVPSSSLNIGRSSLSVRQIDVRSGVTRVSSTAEVEELMPGLTKTIMKKGDGEPLRLGDVATVKYSCSVPNMPPFAKASKQKVQVNPGNGVFIKGWDMALKSMSFGERAIVRVEDPNQFGYGEAGVPPFIPSNAIIEMDIEILDIQDARDMLKIDESGLLSASDSATPRTPAAIAAAYKTRQDAAEIVPEKEGLEGIIDKLKGFYFFGFFEGETGEQAPWILRPSITFPIAFLIVGAAFYASIKLNAISERGVQSTDELDDIVLSANFIKEAIVYAFSL